MIKGQISGLSESLVSLVGARNKIPGQSFHFSRETNNSERESSSRVTEPPSVPLRDRKSANGSRMK